MPKIRKIQLEDWKSVSQRLHAAAVDLLPNDMADNAVVRWVVNHDSLHHLRDSNQDDKHLDDMERYPMAAMVGRLVATHLQQKLPFYFGTLFHIGRMQEVSQYCRKNVESLSADSNYHASARNIRAFLDEKRFASGQEFPDNAGRILSSLMNAAIEHSANQMRLALRWWDLWLQEAGALRDSTEELDEAWRQCEGGRSGRGNAKLIGAAMRTIALCQKPSRLAVLMKQAGVRVKSSMGEQVADPMGFSGIASLFVAFAAFEDGPDNMPHAAMHFEHIIHEWIHDERERRTRPEVEIALDILRCKYGAGNPFDQYLPLCRAATPELRALVQEHQLPDRKASPWRATWEAQLHMEHVESKLPPPSGSGEFAEHFCARIADSVIKRRITEHIAPTETWNNFIQRIYEQHVVQNLGNGAGNANKAVSQAFGVWSLDAFYSLVKTLTQQLNSHGYTLICPEVHRLKTLLNKTSSGKYLWGSGDW